MIHMIQNHNKMNHIFQIQTITHMNHMCQII